ncbi:MAG: efflux RND transporter periplasmic adaptor subunit [Gemmatimonadetes bacterium]|nr:efflux RND transporter periplasmic adaptor subunit [Gemmatimonadota bacterium]
MSGKRIGMAAAVVAVVATGTWLAIGRRGSRNDTLLASGTVEATEADLGFQVAGRLQAVAVQEGDPVSRGAELAWLDRSELEARRAAAVAQLEAARAQLAELERGFRSEELAQGRAALAAAERRLADARLDLERTRRLQEGGAVSREALDKAETGFEVAQSQHDQAREQLRILQTGPRTERIAAQRALVRQAEAALAQADALLANALIRAPIDGVVTIRHREPGEIVSPGQPVLTLANLGDRWIRIYVREDRVGRVRLGQQATITTDSHPGRTYDGVVRFIASEAEFTPRNVQTTEERVKLVYAVKVAVAGDAAQDLKPGLPADVRLESARP